MKRNFNTKDVSRSKINQNRTDITQKIKLESEKESLPKSRKEEKIIQKKKKIQYLDNYQYHEIKDIKDKNKISISIVKHQKRGDTTEVTYEEKTYQKPNKTDSEKGASLYSKQSTNTAKQKDTKNNATKTAIINKSETKDASKINSSKRKKVSDMKIINGLDLEDEIVDSDKQFTIGYSKEFDKYFMKIVVWWIALYDRWYKITKDDFLLYKKDKRAFYKKYKEELEQKPPTCFNENFIGAVALRDYDGAPRFQDLKPSKNSKNPFLGHAYIDGVFYAVIEWEDETVYVPPVQMKNNNFLLHDKCKLYEINGQPACYIRL